MYGIIKGFFALFGRPRLVEFDYRDSLGAHHGHCHVRCFLSGTLRVERMLSALGYTNIHIA